MKSSRRAHTTPERYSRHYADLAALANHDGGKQALCRDDLRERVVAHKKIFFAAAWAAYDTAVPGSFRLVPPEARREELARDYAAMRDMFFHEPPLWEEVIKTLEELETRINKPVA